jgi:hypothetical protein
MTGVTVPFRGRVVVKRQRGDVFIYVSRRDIGGRVLAKYNGARVAGILVVIQEGDSHA